MALPHIPRVTVEVDGVIANRVQAMLDVDVFTDLSAPASWLEILNRKLFVSDPDRLKRCLSQPGFYQNISRYDDFDAEVLENDLDQGTLKLYCLCNRPDLVLEHSELPEQMDAEYQTRIWLHHGAGLRSINGLFTDVADKVSKILDLRADLHVDSDLSAFTACEDAGIPALLWDRPWNQALATDKRISSVGDVLRYLGVDGDRTQLEYAESQIY